MLTPHFFEDFGHHFVTQVKRVLNIDGFITYQIDNPQHTSNYHFEGINKTSINEYLNDKIHIDPVSFRHFYTATPTVALLHEHDCLAPYQDFMKRWSVSDTAELFFRKKSGQPVFGISLMRDQTKGHFSDNEKTILESFYALSSQYLHQYTDRFDPSFFADQYQLTKKESVVLKELLTDLDNPQIAEKLNCSLATVKTHIQHIYQKMNVRNRQELLCKVLR